MRVGTRARRARANPVTVGRCRTAKNTLNIGPPFSVLSVGGPRRGAVMRGPGEGKPVTTDDKGAPWPGQQGAPVPVRPRSAFLGHEVFGHGDGAVLVEPEVARDLRSAAEFASQERRIAGGLLYGHRWADDEGLYLVVDGFLEAGPGENRGDQISRDGRDSFALSEADLRLLREDAARMYSAALGVGWWRSLPGPGEFSARDFESQRELVAPGGAGLLVFGSGPDWGTAYLGTDGRVPGSARSFIPVPRPATGSPRLPAPGEEPVPTATGEPAPEAGTWPAPAAGPGPAVESGPAAEPTATPGTSVATRRKPALTPPPQPAGPRVISPVGVPVREWGGAKAASSGSAAPTTPADVKIVVGALIVTAVLAAVMVGFLLSNVFVAVIVAVVLLVGLSGFLWMSRL